MQQKRIKNKKLTENPIYKYLNSNGLSARQLGNICGINYTTLYRIMKGEQPIRASTALKLCSSLSNKITIQDFIEYESEFNIHRPHTNPLGSSRRIREEKLRQESKRKRGI